MNITNIQPTEVSDVSAKVNNTPPAGIDDSAASSRSPSRIRALKSVEPANQTEKNQNPDGSDISPEDAAEMVKALNEFMDDLQTNLQFSIRDDLDHQVVIEIKNRQTDELVKQIPSEELLAIMENMKEFTGIIFDQSV